MKGQLIPPNSLGCNQPDCPVCILCSRSMPQTAQSVLGQCRILTVFGQCPRQFCVHGQCPSLFCVNGQCPYWVHAVFCVHGQCHRQPSLFCVNGQCPYWVNDVFCQCPRQPSLFCVNGQCPYCRFLCSRSMPQTAQSDLC